MSTIITEKIIRKFIKNQILYKEGLYSDVIATRDEGRVEYNSCDLSNLKNTAASKTFVKYILLKPEFKKIVNGKEKTFTKSMLLTLINNKLTSEQNKEYDNIVDDFIAQNPETIDKWINLLEFSITQIFGPQSALYCKIINNMFLPSTSIKISSAKSPSKEKEVKEEILLEIKEKINEKFTESGDQFVNDYSLSSLLVGKNSIESKHLILFPETFIAINNNDIPQAQIDFKKERKILNQMLRSKITPENFYFFMKQNIFYNLNNSNILSSPFEDLKNEIDNTEQNGKIIKDFIKALLQDLLPMFNRVYNFV